MEQRRHYYGGKLFSADWYVPLINDFIGAGDYSGLSLLFSLLGINNSPAIDASALGTDG